MKEAKLYEQINLWDIAEDGTILGCSGEIGLLYRVVPSVDATLLAAHEAGRWAQSVRGLLAALPAQTAASFIVDIEESASHEVEALKKQAVMAPAGPVKELLSAKAVSLGATQRRVSLYLSVALCGKDFLKLPLFSQLVFPWRLAKRGVIKRYEESKGELANLEGILKAQAAGAGASLARLSREEAISFYWNRLNPAKASAMPARPFSKVATLRSQLALSPAREEDGALWIDGLYYKTVSILALGEHVELGSIDRLISKLPAGSRVCLNAFSLDLESALEMAKGQARRSAGLSFLQGSKNYEAIARSAELDELITLVRAKGEGLYLLSLAITVHGPDLKGANDAAIKAGTLLREHLGGEGLIEDLNHRRLFLAGLPLAAANAPRRHMLTGEACSYLAPLSAPWRGTSGGQGMILRSREGEIVPFDPFDGGTPRHGIVIGSTGSGKSFTMNYLILSLFASDPLTNFVIIDIGGSYRRLCEILGGSYFELSLSERYALNPFPALNQMKEGQDFDPDQLGFLSLVLEKMLMDRVGQNKKRILETALRGLYACVPPGAPPLLGDFLKTLESDGIDPGDRADASEMARSLRFYTDGIYGKVLNHHSNLKPFQGRLTVFDLARLKEHRELQAILVFLIGFGLSQQLADKRSKKVIVFDEAWEFFNDPVASELISRLYRTARKHNAAILSVSQSPTDFLKSQASTAMLANAFWKIFLRLDMGHEDLKAFGLNEPQIEAVRSLTMRPKRFSELLLTYGPKSRVVRVEPTNLEYWTATTNAAECAMEEALAKTHAGDRFSLVKLIAEREVTHAA